MLRGGIILLAVVAFAATGPAAGGLVLQGAGVGTASGTQGFGGGYVCENVPFTVHAVYLPGNRAILEFNWASAAASSDNCFIVSNGGTSVIGTVTWDLAPVPPAISYQAGCTGNEAQGLDCGAYGRVGPYGGPGAPVWFEQLHPEQSFLGTFTAV